MKVLIFTYSITRMAGGVFDAVRDLFTNRVFEKLNIKIYSYFDDYVKEDLSSWHNIPINLFKAYPMLYSPKLRKALLKESPDIFHMEALWRYPQLLMTSWKKHKKAPIVCTPHGMLDPYIIKNQGVVKRLVSNNLLAELI